MSRLVRATGARHPKVAAEEERLTDLVFVGGVARSGTTLLQNMLDSHPGVLGVPELLHLHDVLALRRRLHRSIDQGLITWFCDAARADRLIRGLIDGLLEPARERAGGRIVSEKSPPHVAVFDELHALYPEARFIVVVRDPRAVVNSLLRVGERGVAAGWTMPAYTRRARAATRYVRRHLDPGLRLAAAAPDRCRVVRFEKLVGSPEAVTRELTRFLGIEWSGEMLRPGAHRHLGEEAIVNDVWYDLESFRRDPDPSVLGRWRERLEPAAQVLVTRAFRGHPGLARLGYELRLDHLPAPRRARGHVGWAAGAVADRLRRALGAFTREPDVSSS